MPRPIWNGSISFGLVNVPVRMFTAQSPKDVRFNQLHGPDNSRIRMKRFCEAEGIEVPYDEIVKGYEIAPDQYVVLEPRELEEFVHLDQIDPIYFEKAYYLVPDERSAKAYRLLAEALEASDKVAVAKFVMRTKQYLAALRVVDGVLVLSTMLYADEVVSPKELDIPTADDVEVSERELKMAAQLVDSLTVDDFEPEKFADDYREKVMELIERKAAGEVVVAPVAEAEPTKVVDLLAALEASVAAAKEARKSAASAEG